MESENSQKELDLIDIITICWGWFIRFIWKPILFLCKFILNKWWVAVIAAILGLGASYAYYKILPKYKGYVIYEINTINSCDYMNDVELLNKTAADYKAKVMNLPIEEATKINGFLPHAICYNDTAKTSYSIDYKDIYRTKSILKNKFCVEVQAFDTIAFRNIEQGFLHYFSNIDFYKRVNDDLNKEKENDIEFVLNESKRIDDIDNTKLAKIQNGVIIIDQTSSTQEKLILKEIYTRATHKLTTFPNVINTASPMKVDSLAVNHPFLTYKKFIFLAIVVMYILTLCISYRAEIRNFAKK